MKDNIILIGMPGAGKSTLGVLLAKALNYGFADTDLMIQIRYGKKLYEIIDEQGLSYFLSAENQVLSQIQLNRTVIATGGSAVFGTLAMEHLGSIGTIVYIRLGCEEIERRVRNIKTRGIVMEQGQSLKDLYKQRIPLYEKYADIIVDADGMTIEECVKMIADACSVHPSFL